MGFLNEIVYFCGEILKKDTHKKEVKRVRFFKQFYYVSLQKKQNNMRECRGYKCCLQSNSYLNVVRNVGIYSS